MNIKTPELQIVPVEREDQSRKIPFIVNITGKLRRNRLPGSTPLHPENKKNKTFH